MSKITTIFSSSRSDGNSNATLKALTENIVAEHNIIDLNLSDITYFDYEMANQDDDFVDIINEIIESDITILCSPIYWYSMSAQMKTFFDRFSDLITFRKDLGRKLKGKKFFLVSCGYSQSPPEYFELPFIDTCNYFEIDYKGMLYCSVQEERGHSDIELEKLKVFKQKILENL